MLWYMQLSLEANIGHSKQTIKFAKPYGVWAENMKDYKIWLEERMKRVLSTSGLLIVITRMKKGEVREREVTDR